MLFGRSPELLCAAKCSESTSVSQTLRSLLCWVHGIRNLENTEAEVAYRDPAIDEARLS